MRQNPVDINPLFSPLQLQQDLQALGEIAGTVSKGLSPGIIEQLPVTSYHSHVQDVCGGLKSGDMLEKCGNEMCVPCAVW